MISTATHKQVQSNINTDRERESIKLAAQILEKKTGMKAFARIINTNARTTNDITSSTDVGDVYLIANDHKSIKVIEVKRLGESNFSKDFISRETYKFRDFIVDGANQLEKKRPFPYMYMCFNNSLSAVILFYTKNIDKCVKSLRNGNGGQKYYYVAPLEYVKFFTVKELLDGR